MSSSAELCIVRGFALSAEVHAIAGLPMKALAAGAVVLQSSCRHEHGSTYATRITREHTSIAGCIAAGASGGAVLTLLEACERLAAGSILSASLQPQQQQRHMHSASQPAEHSA